jgi:polysaccharide pyruvyl transferase WcaK-like protein
MARHRSRKRIGILGHVGTRNLGDEAIMAAVIQQIRERCPDAEIIGYTTDPEDTHQRHGITAFPVRRGAPEGDGDAITQPSTLARLRVLIKRATRTVRTLQAALRGIDRAARCLWGVPGELRFIVQCYRRLRGTDLLIVAGSNQLNDYFGGPWGFPYDLFKWSLLAKCARTKVAILCCGAGPLDSWLGKRLIKYTLALADCRSYRDEFSWRLIERIGVKGDNPVCTDLAYGLSLVHPARPERAPTRLRVGINPFPFFDGRYWPEHNATIYQDYVGKLAAFTLWLQERGHTVSFFPTQLRADVPVIEDVRAVLTSRGVGTVEDSLGPRPVSSLQDLLLRIASTDLVVATRYHGILLSAALHQPVVAIAYYDKTRDLMAHLGQSAYVVDINSFHADTLAERFVAMASSLQAIRGELEQRTRALRQTLGREYDRVFHLLEEAGTVPAGDERMAALARQNG